MKKTTLVSRFLTVALLIFCSFSSLFAQNSGSAVSGFVYDDNGKPVEMATVAVRNTATGFSTTTASDKKGYFELRDIPVGTYTIEISAVGAQPTVLKDNVLNLGDRLVLHKITLS